MIMEMNKPICRPLLRNVLGGRDGCLDGSLGRIIFETMGEGKPVVLIHGINAGASNYEWRSNFREFSRSHKVYAPDLPGFGRSEKKPIVYGENTYIRAIAEFLTSIVKEPSHIVTSGLTSAYCIKVAMAYPKLVKGIAMVSPGGIFNNAELPGETSFRIFGLFTGPVLGDSLYNAFVSKPSLEYFLKEFVYADPERVTPALVDYTYDSSHQCPNAAYAPASFVAGLSNSNARREFKDLVQPLLVMWGSSDKLGSYRYAKGIRAIKPKAKYHVFQGAGVAPQFETPMAFNRLVEEFID